MTAAVPARPKQFQALGFLGWFVLCFAASGLGAAASVGAGAFYRDLVRPTWAPPGWLFGPVWSVLYLTMAIAAWLVWREPGRSRSKSIALGLFLAQLAANTLWSWLFFAWRQGGLAFAEIVLLWILIAGTIVAFGRLKPAAGLLLLPYLLWVTFAAFLNWSVWRANPGLLG